MNGKLHIKIITIIPEFKRIILISQLLESHQKAGK